MKQNNYIKYYIVIAILILAISVLAFVVKTQKTIQSIGTTPEICSGTLGDASNDIKLGTQVMSATTLVQAFGANYSSVSATADDDIILYSTDAPTISSVSVGDIVMFKSGALDVAGLVAGYPYYVFTASTSSGFEIASSSDSDTALNIVADFTGGETFYELPSMNDGNKPLVDLSNGKYTTITVDCDGSTVSASWVFVGSISDTKPNIYASQNYQNRWDKIYVNDIESITGIAGDTGIEITSQDHRMFRVYPESLKWFGIRFTDLVAGTCTAKLMQND